MTTKIQPFEIKNIPLILDVVTPMWGPPVGDEGFKRFDVEYILRNNLFENTLHYELVEYDSTTNSEEFCAAAFFARKGDVCKAEEWFKVESEKFDDLASQKLARDVAKRIEDELDYPGQIRVTVVREFRTTEIAK